jgi:hypothetical protein
MVMPDNPLPSEARLEIERKRAWDRFLLLRDANIAAYQATTDEQFSTRVGGDIADQRTYLTHQILYTQERVQAFNEQLHGHSRFPNVPRLEDLSRNELFEILDTTTTRLFIIYQHQENWDKLVRIPYVSVSITGAEVLRRLTEHEAHHEGMNRVFLGHFGIPLPEAVIRPFGK